MSSRGAARDLLLMIGKEDERTAPGFVPKGILKNILCLQPGSIPRPSMPRWGTVGRSVGSRLRRTLRRRIRGLSGSGLRCRRILILEGARRPSRHPQNQQRRGNRHRKKFSNYVRNHVSLPIIFEAFGSRRGRRRHGIFALRHQNKFKRTKRTSKRRAQNIISRHFGQLSRHRDCSHLRPIV
jgi:hypothetical protein